MKESLKDKAIRIMPKLQRPLYTAVFAISAVFFFYSLAFSTDIFPLSQLDDPESFYVSGSEVFASAQGFNRALFILCLVLVILSLLPRLFFSHRRRLFYKSNYITTIAFTAYAFGLSVFTIINVIILRSMYLLVDFEDYARQAEIIGARYVQSTFFFDLGLVLGIITIVLCALCVCLMQYKRTLMLKKKTQTAESEETI